MGWQTPEGANLYVKGARPGTVVYEPKRSALARIATAYEGILAELARLPWEWPS